MKFIQTISGLKEAIMKNCEAVKGLDECVRTSLGCNGLSNIVINHVEKVIVTTDATIISALEVQHPAAKVLCLSTAIQQRNLRWIKFCCCICWKRIKKCCIKFKERNTSISISTRIEF